MLLRAAIRQALRRPAFTLTAVALLAGGLGATVTFFSALDALEWRPLPFPDAAGLRVVLRQGQPAALPADLAHAAGAGILFRTWGLTAPDPRPLQVILSGMVTPDFFRVLGVEPLLGRPLASGDRRELWLSHAFWRSRFAADSRVLGRVVQLNDEPYTITGILPPAFTFGAAGQEPDLFFPLAPGYRPALVLTRRPAEQVQALARQFGDSRPATLGTGPLRAVLGGEAARPYRLLLAATAVLLLVTCLNLGGLLVARGLERQREFATRRSLGAGPGWLLRQLGAEALVLAAGGAAGAWLIAAFALDRFALAGLFSPRLDLRAAALLGLLSLAIAAAFTFAPLLRPRALRGGGPALVATQTALSLVLLAAAGLLLRAFDRLSAIDPGFSAAGVTVAGLGIPEARYDTDAKMARFHADVLARAAAAPGVEAAAAGVGLPFTGAQYRTRLLLETGEAATEIGIASPDLFRVLGIRLMAGRAFTSADSLGAPRVALVNEAFVRAFHPARQASLLGERVRLAWWGPSNPRGVPWQIVGIVADTRHRSLELPAEPRVWLPLVQFPSEGVVYALRARPGADASAALQAAVAAVDPALQRLEPRPLAWQLAQALAPRRLVVRVTSAFALAALACCLFGIFSVSLWTARARQREFAIRAALGEGRPALLRRMLRAGLTAVGLGVVAGLGLAAGATRLLASQLFETRPGDPAVLLPAAAGLLAAGALAALGPAWRASAADPAAVLKEQ